MGVALRVALFGGTFDPPHRGHIAIARAAADRFALDTVLFAPVGLQPHKLQTPPGSFADRLAMVSFACADAGDRRFALSELDAPRPDGSPNYTVDTLAGLAVLFPGATIFNLIGADNFRNIGHWREPERLLELAQWIVISRPGFPLGEPDSFPLTAAQSARVHLLDEVHEDVSATDLRARLRAGESCEELIAPSVLAYIRRHNLYRDATPTA